jgi:hypothetical protein
MYSSIAEELRNLNLEKVSALISVETGSLWTHVDKFIDNSEWDEVALTWEME